MCFLSFLIQGPNKECLLNLVGESYLRFNAPTAIWILVPRPSGTKLMLTARESIDPALRHYYSWQCSANV